MRTEKSLARRAAAGDEAAFEAIFRRYHQEIYRYCRAIVRSEEDARDALQATMLAALRALPGEQRELPLKPWLFRVAHNEAISILRARRPLVDPQLAPEAAVAGADRELSDREGLRELVSDLQALPERQRSALVMRELNGLSFGEIAAAMETSAAAVRQTLYEARESLADMQEGRDLNCAEVRLAISDGDGRTLRGRRLRAHLRSCERCAAFRDAIGVRKAELRSLYPPLPPLVASGLLASVLASKGGGAAGAAAGTASAGAGGAAAGVSGVAAGGSGALGGGVAAGGAVKAASLVAAVVVGAGAADATGVVHLPLVHHGSAVSTTGTEVRTGAASRGESAAGLSTSGHRNRAVGPKTSDDSRAGGGGAGPKNGSAGGRSNGRGRGAGNSAAGGRGNAGANGAAATSGSPHGRALGHSGTGGGSAVGDGSSSTSHGRNPNAGGGSANAQGGNPNAGTGSSNAHGGNPNAGTGSSNAHGGNPNAASNSGSGGSSGAAGSAGQGSSGGYGHPPPAPRGANPPTTTTTTPPSSHGHGGAGPPSGSGQGNNSG